LEQNLNDEILEKNFLESSFEVFQGQILMIKTLVQQDRNQWLFL
jgi:hypothetical protein